MWKTVRGDGGNKDCSGITECMPCGLPCLQPALPSAISTSRSGRMTWGLSASSLGSGVAWWLSAVLQTAIQTKITAPFSS